MELATAVQMNNTASRQQEMAMAEIQSQGINYNGPLLSFNSEDYLPKSAVPEIITTAAKQGAKAGEASVYKSFKNRQATRSRTGLK